MEKETLDLKKAFDLIDEFQSKFNIDYFKYEDGLVQGCDKNGNVVIIMTKEDYEDIKKYQCDI